MNVDVKTGLLKEEYLLLQQFYEDFDKRILGIKGWSATIGIAAIGGGFQYGIAFLWLFAAAASLMFWVLEAIWKKFQYLYAPRIMELEAAFRSERFDNLAPLQIYTSWFAAFQEHGFGVSGTMSLPLVAFPHVVTLVAGILLFVLQMTGAIKLSAHS